MLYASDDRALYIPGCHNIPGRPVGSVNYSYDGLNRIVQFRTTGTDCAPASNGATKNSGNSYTLDAWGNLTAKGAPVPDLPGCVAEPLNETVGVDNRFSGTNRYDAAGNMTQLGAYTYDAENRLLTGGGETYTYDGDGNRVAKSGTVSMLYWLGAGSDSLAESTGATLTAEYIFFGGKRVARIDNPGASETVHYYISDHLGSATVIASASGVADEESIYFPYGGERWTTGSDPNHYKFTGKERDTETGLDYFGARYYGSTMGRFTSPDPLMASAHARDPQTWNRYTYTLNNPLRFVDPDGMEVPDKCAKDPKCTIVVKVNVIYDKTVNKGKGLTDQQKKALEKEQLDKATKDYGKSNIKLDVSYTAGEYTVGSDGKTYVTGLRSDSLNVVASTATPTGAAGDSGVDPKTDIAITFIAVQAAHSSNAFPLWTNTTEHEMAHQFLGDVYKKFDPFSYEANEFVVDAKVAAQAAGMSQQSFRVGLEPRRYAVPLNPEANKPKQ